MYKVSDYNSGNIMDAFEEKKNVILPLGAIEAHSDHLPLSTDILLVEKYTLRLAEMTNSLVLPVMPFGQVWSLSEAPGSINIKEENLVGVLVDIIESLNKNGVKMVTLISSHFGNSNVMKTAARIAYEKYPIKVIYFIYPGIDEVKDEFINLNDHHFFLHACEVETSMMLYAASEHVNMDKAKKGTMKVPKDVDYTPVKWTEFSDNYIIGDARLATKEKGEKVFRHILKKASDIILLEKSKL
jgi:creatinine amidohydrolase